jgi:predicted RNase H-like nuclease (RuvC/YqgF family)
MHLRQARGEVLSESERAIYDAEIARQEQQIPVRGNLEALKALRTTVTALAEENAALRERLGRLEAEVRALEQALNEPAREFLGVQG